MLATLGMAGGSMVVGMLIGITGMGGILIPPFMIIMLGMDTHLAMGTSMASFLPPCLLAIWIHLRHGNIHRASAVPLSAAGTVCVFLGTELKAVAHGDVLNLLLAALVIIVGGMAFRAKSEAKVPAGEADGLFARPGARLAILGGSVGVVSGMTGAGGPVLTVPGMIALGYPPLEGIGAGMVYAAIVCAAGTVGNVLHDSVDFALAGVSAAGQVVGVWAGIAVGRFFKSAVLGKIVAWVCVITGLIILVKTLFLQ